MFLAFLTSRYISVQTRRVRFRMRNEFCSRENALKFKAFSRLGYQANVSYFG